MQLERLLLQLLPHRRLHQLGKLQHLHHSLGVTTKSDRLHRTLKQSKSHFQQRGVLSECEGGEPPVAGELPAGLAELPTLPPELLQLADCRLPIFLGLAQL